MLTIENVKGTNGEFELVVIRPDHFLIDRPVLIRNPVSQDFSHFFLSTFNDGLLNEGSSSGPCLPSLRSRGSADRKIPLNPILVNFAAVLRLRRLIREDPSWGSAMDPAVVYVLKKVVSLHDAVLWDYKSIHDSHFIVTNPSTQESSDIRKWSPSPPAPIAHSSSADTSLPHSNRGTVANNSCTVLERAFEIMEAGKFCCCSNYTPS